MTTDTREALDALMVIAAECAQRKPLRGFEELTEATHIGHRQFGRAHEQADEAVRMLAVRLRAVLDTLAAALATQPAQADLRAALKSVLDMVARGVPDLATVQAARNVLAAAPAQAVLSSCGLTECKNMPKCECCKVWDSMGI